MMGTLAAVLAKKGIRSHKELYQAEVVGDIGRKWCFEIARDHR